MFLDYINTQDFEGAISLFDWDVINFDYEKFSVEMISIFPITSTAEFPKLHNFNKITRKAENAKEIETFISNLLLPKKYYNYIDGKHYPYPITSSDTFTDDIVKEFIGYFDFNRLKDLKIIKIELTEPNLQFTQRHKNNMAFFGEIYGYSECVEYNIYYIFEGKKYFGEITLAKYGEKWYIHHLVAWLSRLGNIQRGRIIEIE
jgi:hypothetical protein